MMHVVGSVSRLLLAVPLLVAALAFGPARPAEAAFSCADEYIGQTIRTSVVVPDGAYCRLVDVVVRGSVTIGANAALDVYTSDIRGSITGTDINFFGLDGTTVRGSISVSGAYDAVRFIGQSLIRGSVAISNLTTYADISTIRIVGSLTFSDFGPGADAVVTLTTVQNNLVCSNVPGGIRGLNSATVGGQVILSNCPNNDGA